MNAVAIPEPDNYGPAMRALTEKQRGFVNAMIDTGGGDGSHTECVRRAGYAATNESARAIGWQLSRHPGILAAIHEEAVSRVKSGAIMATSKLIEIATKDGHKDQFKAVIRLLDQGGLIVTTHHQVTVNNPGDERAQIERIRVLGQALGMDAAGINKLIGVSNVTDVEFEIIQPARVDPLDEFILE